MQLHRNQALVFLPCLAFVGALAFQAVQSARLAADNTRLAERLNQLRSEESALADHLSARRQRQELRQATATEIPKTKQQITRLKTQLATNQPTRALVSISQDEVAAQAQQLLEEKHTRAQAEEKQRGLVAAAFREFLNSNRGKWPSSLSELSGIVATAQTADLAAAIRALQEGYDLMPPNQTSSKATPENTLFLRSKNVREQQIEDRVIYAREYLVLNGSTLAVAADSNEKLAAAEEDIAWTTAPAAPTSDRGN